MGDSLSTLADWIDIDSVTGGEGEYADALIHHLESLGFDCERQALAEGRFNVLARAGEPLVCFCTHLDTVPPWFGPRRERGIIHGRGACDAKGPALAMIEAAKRLLASGEKRIGFLFTVGEETDGAGAQLAERERTAPWEPRFTIVGEPTDNRFIRGGKGVYKAELCARGVAGHSSQPIGPSAIHELVGAIGRILEDDWGRHELYGDGSINFGNIEGGLAANVVAPEARASLLVRAVEGPEVIERRLRKNLGENVELIRGKSYGPVEFVCPHGEEGPIVAFGTDAPWLKSWGKPLLYGPGSIKDAHTDHEMLRLDSFEQAAADYEDTVRTLLERL
ncbi:MAG: peptidase dimerization protein [Planctomycetes bacterium]|jgi:acetylornithine deacetylase|nr:peptidase dimerization protein [Planctomycetota bacterium]